MNTSKVVPLSAPFIGTVFGPIGPAPLSGMAHNVRDPGSLVVLISRKDVKSLGRIVFSQFFINK